MTAAVTQPHPADKNRNHSNTSLLIRIYVACKQAAYFLKTDVSLSAKLIAAVFSLFSITTAHFAGLLTGIPTNSVSWVGTTFAASFIATFLLYASVAYVSINAIITVLEKSIHLVVLPIMAAGNTSPFAKRSPITAARGYINYYRTQALVVSACKIFFPLLIFVQIYIGPTVYNGSAALIAFILIASSIATPYGVGLSAFRSINKLREKGRPKYKKKALVTAFTGVSASLMALSFFTGAMRLHYLAMQPAIEYKSATYSGELQVLLEDGDSVFGIAQTNGVKHYLLVSNEKQIQFPVSVER